MYKGINASSMLLIQLKENLDPTLRVLGFNVKPVQGKLVICDEYVP